MSLEIKLVDVEGTTHTIKMNKLSTVEDLLNKIKKNKF